MKLSVTHGLAAAVLALSQGAMAANFDFTGYGSANGDSSLTVASTDGLINATLTAPGEDLGAYNLDGIGVKTGFFNLPGLQNNETLRIDFDNTIDIGSIHMRQWEGPDRVVLNYYGDSTGSIVLDDDTNGFDTNEYFTLNLSGVDYITVTGDSGATVTLVAGLNDVAITSEVPVPAAAWLFGSALLGLGARARRK